MSQLLWQRRTWKIKKAALDKARERRENNDGTDSDKANVKR